MRRWREWGSLILHYTFLYYLEGLQLSYFIFSTFVKILKEQFSAMSDRIERNRYQKSWIFFCSSTTDKFMGLWPKWLSPPVGFVILNTYSDFIKTVLKEIKFWSFVISQAKYKVLFLSYYHKEYEFGPFIYFIYTNCTLYNNLIVIF